MRLIYRAWCTPAVFLALADGACRSPTGAGDELAAARQRWAERGPASYSMTVERSCFCLETTIGPVVLTVRGGSVESRHYAVSGAVVPAEFAELFPTVDGLFARIAEAQRENVHHLRVEYDRTLGYPVRVDIDPHRQYVDDELTYFVSDFQSR